MFNVSLSVKVWKVQILQAPPNFWELWKYNQIAAIVRPMISGLYLRTRILDSTGTITNIESNHSIYPSLKVSTVPPWVMV